jgi:hypothetical protein
MLKIPFLFLFLLALLFSSCKKKYSCQCVTTLKKTGYSNYTVSSLEQNSTKTTKKTAEKICIQSEKQLSLNHSDYISGNEKVTVSCALK